MKIDLLLPAGWSKVRWPTSISLISNSFFFQSHKFHIPINKSKKNYEKVKVDAPWNEFCVVVIQGNGSSSTR